MEKNNTNNISLKHLRMLLFKNEVEKTLSLLNEYGETINNLYCVKTTTMLNAQLIEITKLYQVGTIDYEKYRMNKNKIIEAVFNFIQEINDESSLVSI